MASYIITASTIGTSPTRDDIIGTVLAASPKKAMALVQGYTGRLITAYCYDKSPELWKVRADAMGSVVRK